MSLLLTSALVVFALNPAVELSAATDREVIVSIAGMVRTVDASAPRDPFKRLVPAESVDSPRSSLQDYNVKDLKVTGLIRTTTGSMAVVVTSDGKSFIARSGDALADGVVLRISANEVVFRPNANRD